MILPRRVLSARDREQIARALRAFNGLVILYPSDPAPSPPQTRLVPDQREAIVSALYEQTDPQCHIWIATGRDEVLISFLSLLHATVNDSRTGADVDLLLSISDCPPSELATGYDGFGEFTLLTLLLERMGITRLKVPISLDAQRAGFASAGWSEAKPGVWVWEQRI